VTQPLSIQAVSQALVNAGQADGFRQGLKQCADNLRNQARAWRAEAQTRTMRAWTPLELIRTRRHFANVDSWASKLEELAGHIDAEHQRRERETDQRRKNAEALMSAFENNPQGKRARWWSWRR
jgi:hypothetical protein